MLIPVCIQSSRDCCKRSDVISQVVYLSVELIKDRKMAHLYKALLYIRTVDRPLYAPSSEKSVADFRLQYWN